MHCAGTVKLSGPERLVSLLSLNTKIVSGIDSGIRGNVSREGGSL